MASGFIAVIVAALSFSSTTSGAPTLEGQSTYIPIAPCRLFDTRPAPANVGPRATPLGPADTHTQQVTGPNGNCNVPSGATAVTMNTTAMSATAWSFATIYPTGTTLPNASSLNYVPGQAPTPNSVTATLSPSGAIDIYNAFGSVDLFADVTGYFTGEGLQQIEDTLAGKADAGSVYTRAEIDALLAGVGGSVMNQYTKAEVDALLADKADRDLIAAALDTKADAADVYTKSETDAQHDHVYTKDEVDQRFTTERVWTANVNSAGSKTSPGMYTSTRMAAGWYRISFNVQELEFSPGVDRVITATSNCTMFVGNTGDSEVVFAGVIGLIVVDIQVVNAIGNPTDCPIDVMMKIVE